MTKIFRRRWRIFSQEKRCLYSLILLGICFFTSCFAELLCNDKPIAINHKDKIYFPAFKTYLDTDFGEGIGLEMEYHDEDFRSELNWEVWPLIRFGPSKIDFDIESALPSQPDTRHLLGTDDRGRDILARLIYGFRLSLSMGLALGLLQIIIGFLIGGIQGYYGGQVDLWGQRIIEVWSSVPELFLLILMSATFEPSILLLIFLLSITGWMGISDYVRAEFLRARNLDYAASSKVLGGSSSHTILRHILPNALTPVLTFLPFRISAAISSLAALDFLGLGLPSSQASLGEMLAQGKANLHAWWIITAVFAIMVFMLLTLNFIGEGLQKAMHPQAIEKET